MQTLIKPTQLSAIRSLLRDGRIALSEIAATRNRRAEAEEWLEQVLDEYPRDAEAGSNLGYLWLESGQRPRRSLAMIQLAVATSPENASFRGKLGWAYCRLGEYEKAVKELQRALSAAPNGVILDHLGRCSSGCWQADRGTAGPGRRRYSTWPAEKDERRHQAILQKVADLDATTTLKR